MTRLIFTVSFALVVAVTSAAWAEQAQAPPDDAARERARTHAEAARRHFDVGRFEQALEQYTAAYEASPDAAVLFNMGQCHRLMGNHERAIFFFSGYLRQRPDARNRALIEELLARSRELYAEQQAEEARAQTAQDDQARIEAERAEEEARLAEEERRLAEQEARLTEQERRLAEQEAAARSAATSRTPVHRTWWFWTIIGVVAAGAAAGVAVGVTWEPDPVLPSGSLGTIDGR